jgi:hypothetical protein
MTTNLSTDFIDSLAERVDHADCYGGKTWFDCHEGAVIVASLRELLALREAAAKPVAARYRYHNALIWQYVDSMNECVDAPDFHAQALYAAPQLSAEPVSEPYKLTDGWVIVPKEMTAEMRDAWDSAPSAEDDEVNMQNAYRGMIAAAPQLPSNTR